MTRIILENLTKEYKETVAVKDLSLEIKDKEFLVLLGPSGCGKTTTLRLLCGLEVPTRGHIYLDNKDITYAHPKDRKMAMVFQSYALYPHMTAFDNIAFPLKITRRPKEEIRKRVKEVAALLGIEQLLNRYPKALSGGERQRVALGRAMITKPEVFLLDEPLSNVDAKLRVLLRGEIRKIHEKVGATTVYVTHDQVEAMTMGDRIAIMNAGEILQVSPPYEVYDNPLTSFVAGFIGSPPMNLIDCNLIENNEKVFLDVGQFKIDVSSLADSLKTTATSSKLLLGIRPENILVLQGKAKEKADFTAHIYSIEPLGMDVIATVVIGNRLLRIRVPRDLKLRTDEEVGISFNRQMICIFDAETGKRCV